MNQRKKMTRIILFALVISFIAGMAMAGEDMSTITGTIEVTDAGVVIKTDEGNFAVTGADLVTLAGKKVEAVGKVSEGDSGKVLNVVSIKEIKE
ncbi:MAG: hypothetical protein DSY90_06515 [Deltaproteobacteria bacterium]|nr:MAG: hypothetical protein DSY90_06515 [Deltaproteobacteria bacterium]RUA02686.1 MAG: hypothetical protein DSY89_02390 [Deltaproteobacteria bacterium]